MRLFLLFSFLFFVQILVAQPPNDECLDAIVLNNISNYCSAVDEYSNAAATLSTGYASPTNCVPPWNGDQRDVWFTFTVPIGGVVDYQININGNSMSMPQVALYRGSCSYLAEFTCATAGVGENDVTMLALGLDPGIQYWIRVNDWENTGGSNEGDFQLCISEYIAPVNMMNGTTTSCTGILYDSGGDTGNYLNNEAYTYTICPTSPPTCLIVDVSTFSIEQGLDFLRFYNGPDPTFPLVGELTGTGTNATIEANSGCMTIVWTSNFTGNDAGWEATWACSSSPCTPDGSGISPPDVVDCSGAFLDSGADTTGYLANENWDFSICPNIPNSCITMTLDQFDIATPDVLSFYDGPDTSSPFISEVSGTGQSQTIFAASGCMTVSFNSNFQINGSGWSGSWSCSTDPCPLPAPMTVNTNVTGQDLIDMISAPGVIVLNVDTSGCPLGAMGTFETTGYSEVGMEGGIILATGMASNASGPNDDGGGIDGFNFNAPGDPLLDAATGQPTFDACALEFDIYAATDELTFNYVFASEEYLEYVGTQFNDVFGFFISGPGITGEQNIALVPNTLDPVTISNINDGVNSQYFVDNANGVTVEYDGFTTVLTAEASVMACDTYHLKLVIADVEDGSWDSGVFIEAGSLTSGVASVIPEFEFSPALDYTIEGCAEASITIKLDEAQVDTTVIYLNPTGTATPGDDYTALPDSIVFLPGEIEINVPFNPIFDGLAEGSEFVTINLVQVAACGTFIYDSATVEIRDNVTPEFVGHNSGDTLTICRGDSIQLIANGGVSYEWSPSTVFSDATAFNPFVFPSTDTWIYNEASVAGCTGIDSLFIQVREIDVEIPFGDTIRICMDDLVQLESVVNVSGGSYNWEPAADIIGTPPTVANPAVQPEMTTTYYVTYSLDGCPNQDSIVVDVGTTVPLNLSADTTVCAGSSVSLGNTPNGAVYSWSPTTGLNNANIANPTATPLVTTTYTVTGTSNSGTCVTIDSITITIVPSISVTASDDATICVGDSTEIQAITNDVGAFFWAPSASVVDPFSGSTMAYPTQTTTYLLSLDNGNCTVYDSLTITVLTELPLELVADTTICKGESVVLGEPGFPDAVYTWTPADYLDDAGIPNPLATPDVTTTYSVSATNGFCDSNGDVTINILEVPEVDAGDDITICEGESTQLVSTGNNASSYTWTPTTGLDDPNIVNPMATPTETTTYYIEYANDDCSTIDSVTVFVDGTFTTLIDPNQVEIPQGDTVNVQVTLTPTGNLPLGEVMIDWTPTTGILLAENTTMIAAPLETTTYIATATSPGGCSSTTEIIVEVVSPKFAIPNAFSPNEDGLNEVFKVEFVGNVDVETFQIFDRWGEVVFNNETASGWDGKYEGEIMPQGVYVYYIKVILPDGTQEILKGDVNLLR